MSTTCLKEDQSGVINLTPLINKNKMRELLADSIFKIESIMICIGPGLDIVSDIGFYEEEDGYRIIIITDQVNSYFVNSKVPKVVQDFAIEQVLDLWFKNSD